MGWGGGVGSGVVACVTFFLGRGRLSGRQREGGVDEVWRQQHMERTSL